MRTQLLCALTFLCGAQIAQAQQYPANGYGGGQQQYPGYGYGGGQQQYPASGYGANQPQYPGYGYNQNYQQYAQAMQQGQGYYAGNGMPQGGSPMGSTSNYQGNPNYGPNGYYPNTNNNLGYSYGGGYPYGYSQPTSVPPSPQPGADSAAPVPLQNAPAADTMTGQQPYTPATMQPYVLPYPGPGPDDRFGQAGKDPNAFHRPINERFWVSGDYTMAWFRPQASAGPLVTTGSAQDASPGALGQPATAVLYGDRPIDFGMFSGIRAEAGVFLDNCDQFSLEGSGFYMFTNNNRFELNSDANGNPVIARPVVNAITGQQISYLDAIPGLIAGGVSVDVKSELLGAELNAACHAYVGCNCHLEGLFGFRYVRLAESLTIHDHFAPLVNNVTTFEGATVNPPDTLADMDSFKTDNDFYGLQLGGRMRWEGDWCSFACFGKAGVGATQQQVGISGSTTLFTPTGTQVANGGVLALPTNIGQHDRTVLGFVSELGATFGVNVCSHLEVSATYSFLYWNQVVRPSAQIDRSVNVSQVPSDVSFGQLSGPPRPGFNFNEEWFWAQTVSFGLTFHY